MYSSIQQVILCVEVLIQLVSLTTASVETIIIATTPVANILEGGILSLHCQVWNLHQGHEVAIFRTVSTGTERISLNENVPQEVDNRVYLAVRQAQDGGSRIYFLSVIDASKADEGRYSCKVNTIGEIAEVAVDSIDLKVMYFPSDSDPSCSTNSPSTSQVSVGTKITLNCSSVVGYPEVSLKWNRNGRTAQHEVETFIQNGRKYMTLTVEIGSADQGSVYQCDLTSEAFPERKQSCHIGPFTLTQSALDHVDYDSHQPFTSGYYPSKSPKLPNVPVQTVTKGNTDRGRLQCRNQCSYYNSNVLFWIIGTIVACAFAILFFVIFIGIVLRYRRRLLFRADILTTPHVRDDIYSELDHRSVNKRVYISLERQKDRPLQTLQ
ncbi:uncharacterized protein [Amphiura filiformis]|uniref:uncharacterized protein n=1 Tax=Amphiura filiformis TaxID=82378 RepID=UPI003B2180E9